MLSHGISVSGKGARRRSGRASSTAVRDASLSAQAAVVTSEERTSFMNTAAQTTCSFTETARKHSLRGLRISETPVPRCCCSPPLPPASQCPGPDAGANPIRHAAMIGIAAMMIAGWPAARLMLPVAFVRATDSVNQRSKAEHRMGPDDLRALGGVGGRDSAVVARPPGEANSLGRPRPRAFRFNGLPIATVGPSARPLPRHERAQAGISSRTAVSPRAADMCRTITHKTWHRR